MMGASKLTKGKSTYWRSTIYELLKIAPVAAIIFIIYLVNEFGSK